MSAFQGVPNFTMCLGPGCGSGQIHDGGDDQPIMTCSTCQYKTCFTHKMPWHPDQTCAEYEAERQILMEQNAASEKLIGEISKTCPNPKCGVPIEKNGGCEHMTCKMSLHDGTWPDHSYFLGRKCSYGFCYICLAPWLRILREGNTAHAENCAHHTNNLGDDM